MIRLVIISPKGIYFDKQINSLSVKLTTGYRTILSNHAPLIGALDYAPMHIKISDNVFYFAIHGGAISIKDNKITLLVNAVESQEEIDIERAKNAKQRAEDRLSKKDIDINIDVERARLALLRSIARIKTYDSK